MNYLNERDIFPGIHYPVPIHLQTAYKDNIAIINDWNKLCAHKNSLITFHDYKNKLIKGKFIGIDKEGRAIIDINGKLSYYLNGELTL